MRWPRPLLSAKKELLSGALQQIWEQRGTALEGTCIPRQWLRIFTTGNKAWPFPIFLEHLLDSSKQLTGRFEQFDKVLVQNRLSQGNSLLKVPVTSLIHVNGVESPCNLPDIEPGKLQEVLSIWQQQRSLLQTKKKKTHRHGVAEHSYDGLAIRYLGNSDFVRATTLPEGGTQPSSSQHTRVQGQQQAIQSPKGGIQPSISHQTGVEGQQQQTKNSTEGRTQPSSSPQTGMQGQPQVLLSCMGIRHQWQQDWRDKD